MNYLLANSFEWNVSSTIILVPYIVDDLPNQKGKNHSKAQLFEYYVVWYLNLRRTKLK